MYFYGRGKLFIGERDAAGKLLAGKEFHCPSFEIEVEVQRLQHKNTSGAVAALDLDVVTEYNPKLTFSVDTLDETILAMALAGEVTEVASGGSFSAKQFPSGLADGDVVPVPGGYSNLESLAITDSAGSPATLTAGTHYTVDLATGLVTFLSVAGKTQPFKAAGSENDAFNVVSIATLGKVERFLRFSGINLADDNQAIYTIDIYRASINPTKATAKATGNDVQTWEFSPMLLIDPNALFAEDFGKFGRWLKA